MRDWLRQAARRREGQLKAELASLRQELQLQRSAAVNAAQEAEARVRAARGAHERQLLQQREARKQQDAQLREAHVLGDLTAARQLHAATAKQAATAVAAPPGKGHRGTPAAVAGLGFGAALSTGALPDPNTAWDNYIRSGTDSALQTAILSTEWRRTISASLA